MRHGFGYPWDIYKGARTGEPKKVTKAKEAACTGAKEWKGTPITDTFMHSIEELTKHWTTFATAYDGTDLTGVHQYDESDYATYCPPKTAAEAEVQAKESEPFENQSQDEIETRASLINESRIPLLPACLLSFVLGYFAQSGVAFVKGNNFSSPNINTPLLEYQI